MDYKTLYEFYRGHSSEETRISESKKTTANIQYHNEIIMSFERFTGTFYKGQLMILNIIIMNEVLHILTLKHSLINPNQLRHYQTIVNDDPYDEQRLWIEALDGGSCNVFEI